MIGRLNPYSIFIDFKNYFYDQKILKQIQTKIKIISIGNLNTGGSGKTPMIQFLAEALNGQKILIVCKSYKALLKKPSHVDLTNANAVAIFGDEACLLQKLLPHCQVWSGPDKTDTVTAALSANQNYDVVFIDDGFSHRKLFRHRDIILVDTSRKTSHYHLFPLGQMRESWKTLTRSDLVILTKTEGLTEERKKCFYQKINPYQKNVIEVQFKSNLESEKKDLFLITGIANPEKLKADLQHAGFSIQNEKFYADHFAFPDSEQVWLLNEIEKNKHLQPVMTAKDLIKITNPELIGQIKLIDLKIKFTDQARKILNEKILS